MSEQAALRIVAGHYREVEQPKSAVELLADQLAGDAEDGQITLTLTKRSRLWRCCGRWMQLVDVERTTEAPTGALLRTALPTWMMCEHCGRSEPWCAPWFVIFWGGFLAYLTLAGWFIAGQGK